MGYDYPLVNIQKAIENGPVEIVDLPMKNSDFPWFFVCLPEGNIVFRSRLNLHELLYRLYWTISVAAMGPNFTSLG